MGNQSEWGPPLQEMRNSDIHRCCWCRNSRKKLKAQQVIWRDDQVFME